MFAVAVLCVQIWLMIFQLREILDKQREQAANDAKQAAWKSKQKQKQASKAAGASGGAAGAVGVAGSGMVVPGEEEAKERARAVRMLQACAPALLWSSRAGPARCCLLVGAMTGAGYRGGDALKLLAEDSLNSLEEYSPQQVAEVVGGFARLGFVPGPGWSITLFQVRNAISFDVPINGATTCVSVVPRRALLHITRITSACAPPVYH